MDTDSAFDEIRTLISQGRGAEAVDRVRDLATADPAPMTRIKCLSLLKVVGDSDVSKTILSMMMDSLPEDRETLIQIAGALRGLDFPSSAYSILKGIEQDDQVRTLMCMCLEDLEEYEMALEVLDSIQQPRPFDRVMRSEVLSALAGRDKELTKFVRGCLKEKDADANALAAYAMRVLGNIKAAAGYATRAIKLDPRNVSAMETLGICLAHKGEYEKARIVAGAINEVSPGSKAALNVLSFCDGN